MVGHPAGARLSAVHVDFVAATVADAAALVAVQVAAFRSDSVTYPGIPPGGPPGYDSVDVMSQKIAERSVHAIRGPDRIVGGIVVADEGEGTFHLDLLFVDPDHHNAGVGSQAMEFLDRTYPARRWTLHTPAYAVRNHHFYEKFGYVAVGEEHEPGITLIAYERLVPHTG